MRIRFVILVGPFFVTTCLVTVQTKNLLEYFEWRTKKNKKSFKIILFF